MTETKYKNIFVEGTQIYKLLPDGTYHPLCQWVDNTGYYQVVFRIDGKRKYVRVHRLIAETLIPNENNLPQVNHKDTDKLNNDPGNLEWCTNSYNTQYGYDNGSYHNKHRCHKVRAINKTTKEIMDFTSIRNCADTLKLNRKTITAILKHEKANNYEYDFEYL